MKRLPLLLASALLIATASANDQIRDVQGSLKTQGFFYGEITGTQSAETDAAIRRFQIRNGITVTGKLNADTLSALGLGEKKTAATAPPPGPASAPPVALAQKQINPPPAMHPLMPKPGEPVTPLKREAGPLPDLEVKDAAQIPLRRARANDPAVVEPPSPLPAPVSTSFTTMFRDTPYATAPREVQMVVIRRAQSVMAARRIYRGPLDGFASPATSEAIFLFQDDANLRRTGRLDFETLAEMKLLPPPPTGSPLLKPFFNPNRRRDRSVLPE